MFAQGLLAYIFRRSVQLLGVAEPGRPPLRPAGRKKVLSARPHSLAGAGNVSHLHHQPGPSPLDETGLLRVTSLRNSGEALRDLQRT